MRRSRTSSIVSLIAVFWLAFSGASADEATIDGRSFTLPTGFSIERAVVPGLVDRPIVADFDEKGVLYVADSSGSNEKVQKQLEEKPHRIVRLEDTDGDGVFDRRTIFADKMMFPEGTMWYDGSLYVAAPPSIWKLTDTDHDGVADQRVEWFQGKTLTGCANDLHGPYLGPDGWIYWCKGAFARQSYERPGKSPFVTRAAHIFRCRPDGTGLEPVMTGGMDNPVDVVFTPGGERIFTTTFLQHPGDGKRDGLIHAIYGGVYGKVHDVIEGHPRTSPEVMPVLVHLGAAAPAGLVCFESPGFGQNSEGLLFACNFNMSKVTRHRLTPRGATFSAETDDFLVSTDRDFHPTDVVEDADGSLLVVDTGGWYKLCCPTSQLPKPDVLGTIYRIRFAAKPRIKQPRGEAIRWSTVREDELISYLSSPLFAVRRRAIETLAKRGIDSWLSLEAKLAPLGPSNLKRSVLSTACRIDDPQARYLAQKSVRDVHPLVRQTAIHSISLWRDRTAVPLLIAVLESTAAANTVQNRRAAAEALGRIGDKSAVSTLLKLAGSNEANDPILWHSYAYALIEIADPAGTAAGLTSDKSGTQRAALVALDQMEAGGLEPAQVVPFLTASDPKLRAAASWIAGRHTQWAGSLAGYLRSRLREETLSDETREQLTDQLASLAREAPIQKLLSDVLLDPNARSGSTRLALQAIARSGVKPVPREWLVGLTSALKQKDLAIVREAVATARAIPEPTHAEPEYGAFLQTVGTDATRPDMLRLEALSAVPRGLPEPSSDLFSFLLDKLQPAQPAAERMAAASVLARAKLSREQFLALTEAVKRAGPLELDRLLSAFEKTTDETIGLKLLAALKASSLGSVLRPETLKPRLDKFGGHVRSEAEPFYATLNTDAPAQKARLDALLPTLNDGDIIRGQKVFNGSKAACLSCHAIGYLGGKVGPDLTSIGKIRTDRDLLEAIVYPSLSFVRSYEPLTLATRDGKVLSGVLKSDASDEVVLAINATDIARVPRSEIEEMRPGSVSVMPAGLDQQLSRQELADLLAFLKSRK
jgi:putative membrane-bound dehydrogenase-like protein